MNPMMRFQKIDEFLSLRLDADLSQMTPGRIHVVETDLRFTPETSYWYHRAGWWVELADGRSVINVPTGAGEDVRQTLRANPAARIGDQEVTAKLQEAINRVLDEHGLATIDEVFPVLSFSCAALLLIKHAYGECRRLTDTSLPTADGFAWPPYSFVDGLLYGVIADGKVVSVASARRLGICTETVVDVGITTATAYQGRGYAKTAVSALVEHMIQTGGEALYNCRPANLSSQATARSVGFIPYANNLIFRTPLDR